MQHQSVRKLFQEQLKHYSSTNTSAKNSPIISFFVKWTQKQKINRPLKIGEFGGASGALLIQIKKMVTSPVKLYNIELIKSYQKYQVSKKIKFSQGSILHSQFPKNSFDCLIIRDVLHHLIGKSLKETLQNQEVALGELKRLLRPNGVLFIEELVNCSDLAARMIYFLSKTNSQIGLRVQSLEISPSTIVCFLTPKRLQRIIQEIFGTESIVQKEFFVTEKRWQVKVAHLGVQSGKLILAIKKTA